MSTWTPGLGKPYFREPQFYVSPSIKEANLPDARINVGGAPHRNYNRYYTDDEIMEIWAKPLEKYQVSEAEKQKLQANPYAANTLLLVSAESPCKCHVQNMLLDKCNTPTIGLSNKTMLQDTACNFHFYNLMKCMMKHWKWYELRREAIRQALPEEVKKFTKPSQQLTKYDVEPKEYYKKN